MAMPPPPMSSNATSQRLSALSHRVRPSRTLPASVQNMERIEMADESKDHLETRRRKDLAKFLRAKRAALSPADFGLPTTRRRRAPGLLREEIAQLAGIGVTWYTWLEQGRDIQVSTDLLQRLTRVLRLPAHDAAYLISLAGQPLTPVPPDSHGLVDGMQTVLDGYVLGPAAVFDVAGNTLAFNQIGDFIYHFSSYKGPWGVNLYWRLFMDPHCRNMYLDWPDFARFVVGLMRGVYASRKEDSAYYRMIDDLCRSCPEFSGMWTESVQQGTSSYAPNRLSLQVAGLGILKFLSVRFAIPTSGDWALFLAPQDEATRNAMLNLAPRSGR
jgi:transcriptional regulator with XRE-family HTH domain